MVTTNLTHGRPYGLPLDDETSRLFFKAKDLKSFFPESVLNHLIRHSKRYSPAGPADPPRARSTRQMLELPVADLPVVVAARLSLSFPVLFSTVPLWAIDYEPPPKKRRVRRCRFSDGGICSNFPIHLFDATIPEWPTFGILLAKRSIFRKHRFVWLPKLHTQGRGDCWNRFDDQVSLDTRKEVPPLDRFVSFIGSIVSSAKDWDDQTAVRMPGVRNRVVRIYLGKEEGGLNLQISGEQIMDFANSYGLSAGKELVKEFIDPSNNNRPSAAWNEHRWVRFNNFLVGLRERIDALRAAAETAAYCMPLSRQIRDATEKRPLRGSDPAGIPLKEPQALDLENLLAALEQVELAFGRAIMPQPYQPQPPPDPAHPPAALAAGRHLDRGAHLCVISSKLSWYGLAKAAESILGRACLGGLFAERQRSTDKPDGPARAGPGDDVSERLALRRLFARCDRGRFAFRGASPSSRGVADPVYSAVSPISGV